MKPALLLLPFLLVACGQPADRLTDEEALIDAPDLPVGKPVENMSQPAAASALTGSEEIYGAAGSRPDWMLFVRGDAMLFRGRDGDVRIAEVTPDGFRPAPGTYRSGRLVVSIAAGPCSDPASGKAFRDRVIVTAAGKAVRGCGGDKVGGDRLEGSDWTVAAVNGRPTGGGGAYQLTFTDGRVRGQLGCNSLEGAFRSTGDQLAVTDLLATQMLCGQPADQFEREGLAVLRSAMRMERGAGRLRLVSEAGSFDLTAQQAGGGA